MGRLKTKSGPPRAPFTKKEFWDILLIPARAKFPDDETRRQKFIAVVEYLRDIGDAANAARLEKFLERLPTIAAAREYLHRAGRDDGTGAEPAVVRSIVAKQFERPLVSVNGMEKET